METTRMAIWMASCGGSAAPLVAPSWSTPSAVLFTT
jgi:hypothetical protein